MKLHYQRKVLGGLVISAALLMSACGASGGSDASDEKDDKTATTKAEDKETTTTTEADKTDEEAQKRAESVDLTVSDFPDGWTAAEPEPDDGDNPLEECDPSFTDETKELASHKTDDFSVGSLDSGDGTQFAADTKVFVDEDAAKAALEPFDDEEVIACIDKALKSAFSAGAGATIEGELADDDLDKDDIGADETAGISATYKITADADGSTATANIGILVVRNGDIASMITILSLGEDFDFSALGPPVQQISDLQKAA